MPQSLRSALEALARDSSGPGHILPMPGDVTDAAAMEAVVDDIERQHGPIALAFLNAGTFFQDKAAVFDAEMVKKTFDINVGGVANGLQPILTRMVARGRGQVAINASVAGYGGLPTSSAYGATKDTRHGSEVVRALNGGGFHNNDVTTAAEKLGLAVNRPPRRR